MICASSQFCGFLALYSVSIIQVALYSISTRSGRYSLSSFTSTSPVSSSEESIVTITVLVRLSSAGSYSSSPSSHTSSSVRSPSEKPSSASISCMNFVFPLSRKPVTM